MIDLSKKLLIFFYILILKMSEKISLENKVKKISEKGEIKNNKEEKKLKEKEEINPISLLSKDLLDEINSLEEIDFGEKKDSITTQKESELMKKMMIIY